MIWDKSATTLDLEGQVFMLDGWEARLYTMTPSLSI